MKEMNRYNFIQFSRALLFSRFVRSNLQLKKVVGEILFSLFSICILIDYKIISWNTLQGGLSKGYKNYVAEKEIQDETYQEDGVALFRVQGSGPENMQAIQVDPVLTFPEVLLFVL